MHAMKWPCSLMLEEESVMRRMRVVAVALLAVSGMGMHTAQAVSNWAGTADYTQAQGSVGDEDVVGPFDTYDAGSGVVLLKSTGTTGSGSSLVSSFNGFYQSFITNHELAGTVAAAPNLDSTYELTAVASFTESVTAAGAISVTGGSFAIYLDTNPNRNFNTDTGFTDGDAILTGNIIGGTGVADPGFSLGVTNITIAVTGFNAAVYQPPTIASGGGVFTLRMNNPYDASFLNPITHVMGNSVDSGDLKYAADGYIALAVPEARTYAMMLAGLALVGFMARRNARLSV
ncbi:flocculation-associated PEP-CTERM protein PepA [Thiobacillus sp.]